MSKVRASSDLVMIRTIRKQLDKTQDQIYKTQLKSTADTKYDHYYDMPTQLCEKTIRVEDILYKAELDTKSYELYKNLLFEKENVIRELFKLVTSAEKTLISAANQPDTNGLINLTEISKQMLDEIEDMLSHSFLGMNIWNGSRMNESPFVDLPNSKFGENIYLGDDFKFVVYLDDEKIQIGDPADCEFFRNLISGLQLARDSQHSTTRKVDKAMLAQADGFLKKAHFGFSDMVQRVGNAESAVIRAQDQTAALRENLSRTYEELNGITEQERALNVLDMSKAQRELSYMLSSAKKFYENMNFQL